MADREEHAVGIACYANSHPGFKAVLKHRYTDFKVNEVDLAGRVVRLTCLDAPKVVAVAEEFHGAGAPPSPQQAVDAIVQRYAEITGASSTQLEPFRSFLQQAQEGHAAGKKADRGQVPAPLPLTLQPPLADKERRAAVHRLFKSLPGFPRLETDTVAAPEAEQADLVSTAAEQQEGKQQKDADDPQRGAAAGRTAGKPQCIRVALACGGASRDGGGGGHKRKWRDSFDWPGGSLRYTKFVLYKENMDSQQAISLLTKLLRVSHKLFAVAGTKDKRGVTVQQVTAFKLDPARLAGLNPRLRGMRVGNFEFVNDQLRLGDLQGNRFELVLRGIEAESSEVVAQAAAGLRQSGFINYFGLQRFGTGAVPTHRIGQALLCGQWREAVRLLLTPRADCSREQQVKASRMYLEQGDVEGALRLMPRFLVAEPILLQGLKQHGPNGFLNALMMIPRNLRTMYIHAYQSYLWNAAATHRVQTYGISSAVEGDLVLPRGAALRAAAANLEAHQTAPAGATTAAQGAPDQVTSEGGAAVEEADAAEEGLLVGEVHVVTADEAAAATWRMEDVVLPLPGTRVRYPQHATAQVYRELSARDGVPLDSASHGAQDFSITAMSGAYRHVLHRPEDLTYELIRYGHPDADLAPTDLTELQGQLRAAPVPAAPALEAGGCCLALRLAFTLPSSCYATMLIRELTKQSGSRQPARLEPCGSDGGAAGAHDSGVEEAAAPAER